jgi:hypothetical protein
MATCRGIGHWWFVWRPLVLAGASVAVLVGSIAWHVSTDLDAARELADARKQIELLTQLHSPDGGGITVARIQTDMGPTELRLHPVGRRVTR